MATMMQYNEDRFFNPNVCHVCKQISVTLRCECRLVSYCNAGHKQLYIERHMEICEASKKLLVSHAQLWSTSDLNLEGWIQTRKELICLVKLELQRELKPHEVEIIMLAKCCVICRTQTNLSTCEKCATVNFCDTHLDQKKNHPNCNELRIYLSLNRERILNEGTRLHFSSFPKTNPPVVDMETFIENYVRVKFRTGNEWNNRCYFYSDYVSGPLTLHYGMQKMDLLNPLRDPPLCYVIHIIAANIIDIEYLGAWEIFLHMLPKIKKLKVILLSPLLISECGHIDLCSIKCRYRSVNFEIHSMLYHSYVASEHFIKPNVIIGFQADLNNWETLRETLLRIQEQKCPLILTTKSGLEADRNMIKIEEVLDSPIYNLQYLVYKNGNKFDSRRPYRDIENESVYYRNKYLTVYQKL